MEIEYPDELEMVAEMFPCVVDDTGLGEMSDEEIADLMYDTYYDERLAWYRGGGGDVFPDPRRAASEELDRAIFLIVANKFAFTKD